MVPYIDLTKWSLFNVFGLLRSVFRSRYLLLYPDVLYIVFHQKHSHRQNIRRSTEKCFKLCFYLMAASKKEVYLFEKVNEYM